MSNNDGSSMNKIFVETIIKGLEESKNSIESVQSKMHAMELKLTSMEGKQENISVDVHQLLRIIRDGNGHESMMDRMNTIENDQKSFKAFVAKQETAKTQNIQGKWQLRVAMFSGSIALITAIGTALLNYLK